MTYATFIDQEGAVWDMAYAECPRCAHRPTLADRIRPTGYFRCRGCTCLFDEPNWNPAEPAFLGMENDR